MENNREKEELRVNEGSTAAIKEKRKGKDGKELGQTKEKDLLTWSGIKKRRKNVSAVDDEVTGSAEILRVMRYYSVLGVVAKEYGLARSSLIFLIGHYLKNRQTQKHGRVHASLSLYIKDHKGVTSNKLLTDGFLRRVNPGVFETTEKGLQACLRMINAMRYSRDIDHSRYKDLGGNGYMRD